MSRVIKFRAFDPRSGMIEPYSVRKGKAWIIKPCRNDSPEVRVDGVNYYCNWDIDVPTDFPLMQFTGLLDANGVEVYESDIVYVAGLGNAVVRIADHCGVYYETADDLREYSDCAAEGDYPTVIGNIYQHPELLK